MTSGARRFQRRLLQALLFVSLALMLWGVVRVATDGINHRVAVEGFTLLQSPSDLLAGLLRAEPMALLTAGILVLVSTPAIRLVILIADFARSKDWLYAGMGALVGAIIALSFAMRLH